MTVAAVLRNKGHEVATIPAGTRVREAVAELASRRIGAMPVVRGDEVAGMLSERDVLYCLSTDGAGVLERQVDELMTAPAITVAPDMPVLKALSLMTQKRIRHLPVVESGRIVGLVSIGDLVKYRMDQIEQEAAALLNYIQMA